MIRHAFQHRSGRVIALGRSTLSLIFLVASWVDPGGYADMWQGRLLLPGYVAFALVILLVTWSSWIWEQRLAVPSHIADILFFTLLVGVTKGYASPYFSFFTFLILAAAIRWGGVSALLTAVFIILLFLGAAYFADSDQPDSFDLGRFVIRGANLLVLSLTIVWFGLNQTSRSREGQWSLGRGPSDGARPPIREVVEAVATKLNAGRVLFAWSDREEPWLDVWDRQDGVVEKTRLGPEEFPEIVAPERAGCSFLFDLHSRMTLTAAAGRRRLRRDEVLIDPIFAKRFGLRSGLAIPVVADRYHGHLFAVQIPGLCSDDLQLAAEIEEEVGAALQRTLVNQAHQEATEAQLRLALARDLHDGVVQSFTGISLRLKALSDGVVTGSSAETELNELLTQLGEEQTGLRRLIASLRNPDHPSDGEDASGWFEALGDRLARQWGIDCQLRLDPPALACPAPVRHEVEQLLREAVANAVRHGGAGRVEIEVAASSTDLELAISDDGRGFPAEGEFDFATLRADRIGPRSMVERVLSLGGGLALATRRGAGSRIVVTLPLEAASA
jgi:signal transduction histidine kinase